MAIKNKNEIRLYYETHLQGVSECARRFKISARTLRHWIKSEGWEKGAALSGVKDSQALQGEVIKREFGNIMQVTHDKLKGQIRQNLGTYTKDIDSIVLDNSLDCSTDELLLQAMSLNYIQKNIALSTVIAKDELMRLVLARKDKPDPMLIACAEKVARLFNDMQSAFYGKDVVLKRENEASDIENMSNDELDALIAKLREADKA